MVNLLRGSSSDPLVPLIFLGVALSVVAAVAIANRVSTNRRRKAYEAFCLERGYRFEPERPGEEARHVATCRVFSEGHRRTWAFTISGTSGGTPFTAFEYRWTTGSGKNSQTHRIGGLLWTVERSLPQFLHTRGPLGQARRVFRRAGYRLPRVARVLERLSAARE